MNTFNTRGAPVPPAVQRRLDRDGACGRSLLARAAHLFLFGALASLVALVGILFVRPRLFWAPLLLLVVGYALGLFLNDRFERVATKREEQYWAALPPEQAKAEHAEIKAYVESERERSELRARQEQAAQDEALERWMAAEQSAGAHALLRALSDLPEAKNYRGLDQAFRDQICAAGASFEEGEKLGVLAYGTLEIRRQLIIATDRRILIVGKNDTEMLSREQVRSVTSMPSVRGRCLTVRTTNGTRQWWEVQPDRAAQMLTEFWQFGKISPSVATNHNPFKSSDSQSRCTFIGGEFKGNVARRSAQAVALQGSTSVTLHFASEDTLSIGRGGRQIACYKTSDPAIAVDSATSVGRGIRGRRILGAAAASLVSPLIGAPMLIGSTRAKVREAFVLTVEDGEDSAAFSIDNVSFAHVLRSRIAKSAQAADAHAAPPAAPGASDEAKISRLERLAGLLESGALTKEEYESLKNDLLRAP